MIERSDRTKPYTATVIGGAGSAGRRHVEAQIRQGVDTAIYDIDNKRAVKAAEETGAHAILDIDEAIGFATGLVHVTTPDYAHTAPALHAIEAGRAVLVEKPLTTRLDESLRLRDASIDLGVPVFVGANMRLHPNFAAVRQQVQQGEIGEIRKVSASYLHDMRWARKNTPWRNKQNILLGGGIHPIDLMMHIVDDNVDEVFAVASLGHDEEYKLPDLYEIFLMFSSGILGYVNVNARTPVPAHKIDLVVEGTEGYCETDNAFNLYRIFRGKEGISPAVKATKPIDTFAAEIQIINDFLRGIRTDYKPVADIEETVRVMKTVDAIDRSTRSGFPEKVEEKILG